MSRAIKIPLDAPKFKITYVKGFRQNFYIIKSHEDTASPYFILFWSMLLGFPCTLVKETSKSSIKKKKKKEVSNVSTYALGTSESS